MISDMQVNDWLKTHTRMTSQGLVWPRGTVYSFADSQKIARTYLALGLEPSETMSIDLMANLLGRLEALEAMFERLGPPAPQGDARCTWCGELHTEIVRKGLSDAIRHQEAARHSRTPGVQCTVCGHEPHGADQCSTAVSTVEGRVCRCDGVTVRPGRAGMSS